MKKKFDTLGMGAVSPYTLHIVRSMLTAFAYRKPRSCLQP